MLPLVLLLLVACASASGGPHQAEEDLQHWSLLPGGVADRPYISALSVTTNGTTFVAWTGLTSAATSPPAELSTTTGKLTAAIYAINMCGTNQTEDCYASPNRVGVVIAVSEHHALENDFSLNTCTDHVITADSVFDMTIKLNTFGATASWSWLNGVLEYWHIDATTIHVKLRPALAPVIDWSLYPDTGCTATPIRDCNVTAATDAPTLGANMLWSVDETMSGHLRGAVFATQGAIMGYLEPVFVHGPHNPNLEYQLSSSHFREDGVTPQTGSLLALLPIATVHSLYPSYHASNTHFFNMSRHGDAGTHSAMASATWTTASHGTDGVVFSVEGITFSAPVYILVATSAAPGGGDPAQCLAFLVSAMALYLVL